MMDIMTKELKAKPVIKNKFWIVERDGEKIATIQAIDEGGFAYVDHMHRERFATIKLIENKFNIKFTKSIEKPKVEKPVALREYEVYGWPTTHKPYNTLYDVSKKLPLFTKSDKSKSYFCAGYYIVKFSNTWTKATCPKLITLQRYEFRGPYHTKEQMQEHLRIANGE
jgi:hypothetical protein